MGEQGATVLVVDDDPSVGSVLGGLLRQSGLEAQVVRSGEEALARLQARPIDAVITDLRMEGIDGMELLGRIVREWPEVPVVLITAHGSVPLAVEAMKLGAADFVLKPFDREEIVCVIERALAATAKKKDAVPPALDSTGIVYRATAIAEVLRLVDRVASGDSTVLVLGETGTGKELVARALHDRSRRASGPFIKLHCAALPETLLESELFGYEKGAFTGAVARKPGRVELAEGGTLFLDEIGEVPLPVQVKLLRLLQAREFERLGATSTQRADVRFVAATHRDLEAMVRGGTFREDLFYRVNVVPIWLPPLRERPEDIEVLAHHFCALHGRANGRPGAALAAPAVALLEAQSWPGNVRQLENFVERLVVLSDGPLIAAADVERELARGSRGASAHSADRVVDTVATTSTAGHPSQPGGGDLDERRKQAERAAVADALERARGNRTVAARILGISRRTLYNKLEEHGLEHIGTASTHPIT